MIACDCHQNTPDNLIDVHHTKISEQFLPLTTPTIQLTSPEKPLIGCTDCVSPYLHLNLSTLFAIFTYEPPFAFQAS